MRYGYDYNRQKKIDQLYRQTEEWQDKNNFSIYVVVLTIVLLVLFG